MLRDLAVETEVRISAEARFTVLKAFIRRGSGCVRKSSQYTRSGVCDGDKVHILHG
jgi:hypothetical protein